MPRSSDEGRARTILLARHFSDLQAVEAVLRELKRDGQVAESETRFALRSVEFQEPSR